MASMFPPKKNAAFTLSFTLYKNDGSVVTDPGTYTKKVSIDGGAVADIAAAVTEEDTTYGQLSLVLSADEMNGDWIWVYITDNTVGTVPFTCTLYTAANTLDEIAAIIANIHDTDLPAVKSDTAAILTDTGTTLDALIQDIPTVAEFNARTLLAADYFDPAADTVANVTTVANLTNLPATAATAAELAKVPKSDGVVAFNATAVAGIQSGLATGANLATVAGYIDTEVAAVLAAVDTEVASVLSVVNNLHDTDLPAVKSDTAAILADTGTDGVVVAAASKSGYALSAAGVSAVQSGLSTHSAADVWSVGARTVTGGVVDTAAAVAAPVLVDALSVGAIADQVWDEAIADHAGVGSTAEKLSSASAPSADQVADAVWDEVLATHAVPGSTGAALGAAGAAGDPWSTVIPGAYAEGTAGNLVGTNLDAAVSSRLATAGYLAPDNAGIGAIKAKTDNLPATPASSSDVPSADTVADAVWNEARAGHVTAGSFGEGVASVQGNVTGSVASVTGAVGSVTGAVGSVSAAVTVGTNNDKVGYSLAVTPPTAAEIRTEMDANSTKLANLDDTISSRLAGASYTPAATPEMIRLEMDASSTKLANLDATISSRMDSASYVAPDNASILGIKTKTDNLPLSPAATGDIATALNAYDAPTKAELDAAVLPLATAADLAATDLKVDGVKANTDKMHFTGDPGAELVSASATVDAQAVGVAVAAELGNITDPLLNAVPGAYASGTAGAALGKIGAGIITTVSPISTGGAITVIQGDDYNASDARALEWEEASGTTAWPVLTGATITFGAESNALGISFTKAGSLVTPTGINKKVRVELTAANTGGLAVGTYTYQVEATLSSNRTITLASGTMTVVDDVA